MFQPHLADCGYAVIRCPNKGCSEHMERQCMEKHARDDCPKFLTTCPHCKREVMREDVRKHSHSCAKRPMACPNNCGQSDLAAEKVRPRSETSPTSLPLCSPFCLTSFRHHSCLCRSRSLYTSVCVSAVCCLLSAVCCLLSAVCCLLSAVCCLLSAVYCLLSDISAV